MSKLFLAYMSSVCDSFISRHCERQNGVQSVRTVLNEPHFCIICELDAMVYACDQEIKILLQSMI